MFPLLLLACDGPTTTSNDKLVDSASDVGSMVDSADTETDADSDADTDADADADADGDTDSDTDTQVEDSGETDTGDSGEVVVEPVIARFVALGDAGEGNTDQYTVASVMKTVCAAQGCDFALYLGDNFYDNGVDSVDDEQFQSKFELPYAELNFPFYAVLGNHDNGGAGTGYEFWKSDYQVDYTNYSTKWKMPDQFYREDIGELSLYGLDTNTIFWGFGADQETWLQSEIDNNPNRWNIVFGHHPYLSNGQHGNAGAYEGFEWLPIANGAAVESFVLNAVCSRSDVYFSGHDHLRESMGDTCGTHFYVSGAGAKTTDLVGRGNVTKFESDLEGFIWIELQGDTMKVEFWNKDGVMDFTETITK